MDWNGLFLLELALIMCIFTYLYIFKFIGIDESDSILSSNSSIMIYPFSFPKKITLFPKCFLINDYWQFMRQANMSFSLGKMEWKLVSVWKFRKMRWCSNWTRCSDEAQVLNVSFGVENCKGDVTQDRKGGWHNLTLDSAKRSNICCKISAREDTGTVPTFKI